MACRPPARPNRAMVVGAPKCYDPGKDATVIELTGQQAEALDRAAAKPPCVVNPRTGETFVLLRADEYERLKEEQKEEKYDDSPWTREELQSLAWNRIRREDWDEYDGLPEKP